MIVLLGASGHVGSLFGEKMGQRGITFATIPRTEVAWPDVASLREALARRDASFVINCIGYVGRPNVDACEMDKTACLFANAVIPGVVRAACGDLGIPWGHISSGCIFSGKGPEDAGFSEDDCPNFTFRAPPCSFYSGSKALGEEVLGWREADYEDGQKRWISNESPEGYIWRLRMPFGPQPGPRNYLDRVASYPRLLEASNSITDFSAFVDACLACMEKRLPTGIYHLCNPGVITTRQITEWMLEENRRRASLGQSKPFPEEFHFFRDEVAFHREASPVPRSSCALDCSKALYHGIALEPVEKAVVRALRAWPAEHRE
ncbi:MAG: sugar nucleotide-binding protein [Opitutales bacterium]|nr:sugar nucleotide-binding protein [Opitutales bacterium]